MLNPDELASGHDLADAIGRGQAINAIQYGETITRLSKGVHEYLHDGLRVQQWNALNGLVQWHCLRLPPLPRQAHALLSHTCTYGFWTYQWFRVTAMAISIGKADWSESRTWLRIAPRSAMRDFAAVRCERKILGFASPASGKRAGSGHSLHVRHCLRNTLPSGHP